MYFMDHVLKNGWVEKSNVQFVRKRSKDVEKKNRGKKK